MSRVPANSIFARLGVVLGHDIVPYLDDAKPLDSVKTEEGFKSLFAMSTYHHVEDRTAYPAVRLETGINDSRVDPWQMTKMTARLQAATTSGKPVLLRVEYQGGHVSMGGTQEQLEETMADDWSFLLWQFGVPGFQPKR